MQLTPKGFTEPTGPGYLGPQPHLGPVYCNDDPGNGLALTLVRKGRDFRAGATGICLWFQVEQTGNSWFNGYIMDWDHLAALAYVIFP